MNQFMMDAIQQSGSDYSNKQDMLNNIYTSDMMLANRQKQVYNNAVAAAKGKMNTLIGSDYTEIAYYGLDFAKKAYKQYKTAQAQVAAGRSAPATQSEMPVETQETGSQATPKESTPAAEPTYDNAAGVRPSEPTYDDAAGSRTAQPESSYDNIFGAGTPSERMAADPQQAEQAQEATSSLLTMESNPYDNAAGERVTSTDEETYATARAAPASPGRVTETDEPIYDNPADFRTPQASQPDKAPDPAPSNEPAVKPDAGPVAPAETAATDAGKSSGIGGDMLGLAGLGFGIYEEATSDDSPGKKAANIAGQTALYAGVEAVSAINPVAGALAGAAVGLGYLIDDLVTGKKRESQAPVPQAPPPPTMAFSSSAVLDSSA